MENHIRDVHNLTERQIYEGPEVSHLKMNTRQNGLPMHTILDKYNNIEQVVQEYFLEIPDGNSCTLCKRNVKKKTKLDLICHISMAHVSLTSEDKIISSEFPLNRTFETRLSETSLMPDISDMLMMPPPSKESQIMMESPYLKNPDSMMEAGWKKGGDMDDMFVKIEPQEGTKPPILEAKIVLVKDRYKDVKPPVLLSNPPTPPMESTSPAPACSILADRPMSPPDIPHPPAAPVPAALPTQLVELPSVSRQYPLTRTYPRPCMSLPSLSYESNSPAPPAGIIAQDRTYQPARASPPSSKTAPQPQTAMNIPKRVSKHICDICFKFGDQDTVKEINLPNEKLLVLLGMGVNWRLSRDETRYGYSQLASLKICLHHHNESVAQLYTALGIKDAKEVNSIPQEQMEFVMDYINGIIEDTMPPMFFKQLFIIYAEKYPPIIKKSTTKPITVDDVVTQSSKSSTEQKEKPVSTQKSSFLSNMDDVLVKIEPPGKTKSLVLEVKAEIFHDGYEDVKPTVLLPSEQAHSMVKSYFLKTDDLLMEPETKKAKMVSTNPPTASSRSNEIAENQEIEQKTKDFNRV